MQLVLQIHLPCSVYCKLLWQLVSFRWLCVVISKVLPWVKKKQLAIISNIEFTQIYHTTSTSQLDADFLSCQQLRPNGNSGEVNYWEGVVNTWTSCLSFICQHFSSYSRGQSNHFISEVLAIPSFIKPFSGFPLQLGVKKTTILTHCQIKVWLETDSSFIDSVLSNGNLSDHMNKTKI